MQFVVRAAATANVSDICSGKDQRDIILGHTRHYFVLNIADKFGQTGGGNR